MPARPPPGGRVGSLPEGFGPRPPRCGTGLAFRAVNTTNAMNTTNAVSAVSARQRRQHPQRWRPPASAGAASRARWQSMQRLAVG